MTALVWFFLSYFLFLFFPFPFLFFNTSPDGGVLVLRPSYQDTVSSYHVIIHIYASFRSHCFSFLSCHHHIDAEVSFSIHFGLVFT